MIWTLAEKLDEGKLQEIKKLEQEIGMPILAFSPLGTQPADLDKGKLAKLQQLEKSLGVSLIAVKR